MINYANRGISFQEIIKLQNDIYRKQGVGFVQELSVPKKITKQGSFYSEKSTVDFLGALIGTTVAFDAKETEQKTWSFKTNFKPHQEDALRDFRRGGAKAFILLHMKKFGEVYIIPLVEIQKLKALGYKSISPYYLSNNRHLIVSTGNKLPDYLKVLREFFRLGVM